MTTKAFDAALKELQDEELGEEALEKKVSGLLAHAQEKTKYWRITDGAVVQTLLETLFADESLPQVEMFYQAVPKDRRDGCLHACLGKYPEAAFNVDVSVSGSGQRLVCYVEKVPPGGNPR